jgi:Flp pilus assembly protein TadG
MPTKAKREKGATLVEAAIAYGLLFLALFAVVEFGLAFKDWLSVSHASREGARAGATFGQDLNADILVLRNVESTMSNIGFANGDQVRIYRDNSPSLSESTTYTFAPGTGCSSTVIPALPGCCDWSPCPEVGRTTYVVPAWDPLDRDIMAPTTDRIGVQIFFTHDWVTGFFGSTIDFTTSTVFQVEPQLFDVT